MTAGLDTRHCLESSFWMQMQPCSLWQVYLAQRSQGEPYVVGRIIVWYPAHLYSPILVPTAIQQFPSPIQHFFDQKSCLWVALIYPLPIFHFPNPFQTLTQLCHRIEPVFTITTVLHSTLYLFWKPRYRSCQFFVYAFFSATPSIPDTYYRPFERPYRGDPDAVKIVGIG